MFSVYKGWIDEDYDVIKLTMTWGHPPPPVTVIRSQPARESHPMKTSRITWIRLGDVYIKPPFGIMFFALSKHRRLANPSL